jgi:hypothetical protein
MKSYDELIAELQTRPNCHFRPATRLPVTPRDLQLPPDVIRFYQRFSEARLFGDSCDPRYQILPPEKFVQIGEAVPGGEATTVGIEQSWYALVDVRDGNFFGIDLLPERLGWCYDCFHETYGMAGYCKVLAQSFTELLNYIVEGGDKAFWLADDFHGYGDAYES